ncbi:hypothetical protein HDV01_000912 [Terramyces sp. JEL0728]|nr:hypothetical protein HDV01_000912 [Terramyces sp. JEL0728]
MRLRKIVRYLVLTLLLLFFIFACTAWSGLLSEIPKDDLDAINFRIKGVSFKKANKIGELGKALRHYSALHNRYYSKAGLFWKYSKAAQELDKQLFPYLKPSFGDSVSMRQSFSGRGIVIAVGNQYTDMALSTILMIRSIHRCIIRIEIFFNGADDLSKENQAKFKKIPNLKVIDISKIYPKELELNTWDMKPFAMLASSFRKVMLIDADTVFLQSPSKLFADPLFSDHGALFFNDRTTFHIEYYKIKWIKMLLQTRLSEKASKNRLITNKSRHMQESGVVMIDKARHLPGLLATCMLNTNEVKKATYGNMHGDKETFWIGFEIAQEDYAFNPIGAGSIGELKKVTANNVTTHYEVWMNGGIQFNKYAPNSTKIIEATHYVNEPGTWSFVNSSVKNMACLVTDDKPPELPQNIIDVIELSGLVWVDLVQ